MMESWQFFLQKEGDYAWLPLETPQVEILEGRYQLIAHTPDAGASVRVSIRHQYEQENIPQENIQESVRQVGLAGKVEILPLVYLGLGSWSIACHPLSENTADDRDNDVKSSYALDIQVLPQDFDLFDDWHFEASEQEPGSSPEDSFLPMELELADLNAPSVQRPDLIASPVLENLEHVGGEAVLVHESPAQSAHSEESAHSHIQSDLVQQGPHPSRFESDTLILPTFSTEAPSIEFRTVRSNELPRLVSDQMILESPPSPQLPPFTRSQVAVKTKQDQRLQALSKIQFIAAGVSHQVPQRELSRSTRQEKFQSKLSQMAVAVGR